MAATLSASAPWETIDMKMKNRARIIATITRPAISTPVPSPCPTWTAESIVLDDWKSSELKLPPPAGTLVGTLKPVLPPAKKPKNQR